MRSPFRRAAEAEPQLWLETNAATEAALDELRHQLAARDRENDDLTGQLRATASRAVAAEKRAEQAEQLAADRAERIRGLETTVRAAADRIAALTAELEALRGPRPVAVTLVDGDAAGDLLVPWQRQD